MQRLVVESVFDYVIWNIAKLYVIREDQMLLYVKREEKVGKSGMIYIWEIDFTLLN